jgi:hypothetical protein
MEKRNFDTFFSLCQQLDRDSAAFEELDEESLRCTAQRIKDIRSAYSAEDWVVARHEFYVDIENIESKLHAATRNCVYRGNVSSCLSKILEAQRRVRLALDSGNHLLALQEASSHWHLDPSLSSSQVLKHEVEVLRASVAGSLTKIAADREQLEDFSRTYKRSLNMISFLFEQAKYDSARECIEQVLADVEQFKSLVNRCSGVTVRIEDMPEVDFDAISQLKTALTIIAERDKVIERLEANNYCIEGNFDHSYALIDHFNSIFIKSDADLHTTLLAPLLQARKRVDDAVCLLLRELRRVSAAAMMQRVDHLNVPLISMLAGHRRLLAMLVVALEFSSKVGPMSAEKVSWEFNDANQDEVDNSWWIKVQGQLVAEERFFEILLSLNCQHLKDVPFILTQTCLKHPSQAQFFCLATSIIQHHLHPMANSCGTFPLPSLISHIDLKIIIPQLLSCIQNFMNEFDDRSSTLISNINQMNQLYVNSKQQLRMLLTGASDGALARCTVDTVSSIKDDFEKCELLVVRTVSILDFFSHVGLPVHGEHFQWFKCNAANGIKAADLCRSFIEKVSAVCDGNSAAADLRVSAHCFL